MSQDSSNIPKGLNITTQIPLDVKTYAPDENTLSHLGHNDLKAFTYYDGLRVYCVAEQTIWEWKAVPRFLEDTGLLSNGDFTYPNNFIVFGIDYSDKKYNFFKVDLANKADIKEIISSNNSVTINETDTQIDLSVQIADGSETKINAGTNITKTGTGTNSNPYVINANIRNYVQAGTNTIVTGTGTQLDPYIISADNNAGWLSGDTKSVVCDFTYLNNNFEISGLGKNERLGWAIMNGNNGTPDDNGLVEIAYGVDYNTLEATGGNKDAVLVSHDHDSVVWSDSKVAVNNLGTGTSVPGRALNESTSTDNTVKTSIEGETGVNKNMQPYVVRLRIMKL